MPLISCCSSQLMAINSQSWGHRRVGSLFSVLGNSWDFHTRDEKLVQVTLTNILDLWLAPHWYWFFDFKPISKKPSAKWRGKTRKLELREKNKTFPPETLKRVIVAWDPQVKTWLSSPHLEIKLDVTRVWNKPHVKAQHNMESLWFPACCQSPLQPFTFVFSHFTPGHTLGCRFFSDWAVLNIVLFFSIWQAFRKVTEFCT